MLHGIFHPDGEPFRFDWDWLAPSGLSTKDFVAPSSLCFGTAKAFGLGGKYEGAVSFLQILAPEFSDEMLAELPQNGKRDSRQSPCAGHRPDRGHQDHQTENHRP